MYARQNVKNYILRLNCQEKYTCSSQTIAYSSSIKIVLQSKLINKKKLLKLYIASSEDKFSRTRHKKFQKDKINAQYPLQSIFMNIFLVARV